MDAALERLVWEREGSICEYCQMPHGLTVLPFQVDHIIALQHRGPTVFQNLALSCLLCKIRASFIEEGLFPPPRPTR
jgi:hypothetical protein